MPRARDFHDWTPLRLLGNVPGPIFFFVVFYLGVWLVLDPRLIHHSLGIYTPYRCFAFETRWLFFSAHLARAGGLVEYAARFLTTFYAIGWAGAFVITAVALGAGLSAAWLSRRAGWAGANVPCYVAALMILVLHRDYSHPLRLVLMLLAGLVAFALFVRLAPQTPVGRALLLVLMFPAVYQVAAAGSLLFPLLVAVDEFLLRRQKGAAIAAVACGLIVPGVLGTLQGLEMSTAYAGFLIAAPDVSTEWWPLTLALYLLFPAILGGVSLVSAVRRRAARRVSGVARRNGRLSPGRAWMRFRLKEPWRQLATAAVCSCGVGAVLWLLSSSFIRRVLDVDYSCQHGQWTATLKAAERLPSGNYNVRCSRNILLALYHTGRLGDEMFRYGLRLNGDLFYTPEIHQDLGSYYQESRLLYELGHVNRAERCACEALEFSGPHPATLQLLATINLVKHRTETARVFLQTLAFQPLERWVARDWLRRLDQQSDLEDSPQIRQARANMITADRVVRYATVDEFLQALLDRNPRNKMAFDLLMAFYLSAPYPDKVAENLSRLKEFGYVTVPRHYQEAWVIAHGLSDNPPPIS
ncbi:MAG: DUF6057 family protein, partial [Thermoguttaceae bacterium]